MPPRKPPVDLEIVIEVDADIAQMRGRMETLVRDAYNAASARTQIELISGVADQWQWVALLDGDVCPDCEELDGEIFSVGDDEPPLHPNCRCSISPVIDVESLHDTTENLVD